MRPAHPFAPPSMRRTVTRIARYGKVVAREGRGENVAALLLGASRDLEADPGCELYLVNRQVASPMSSG